MNSPFPLYSEAITTCNYVFCLAMFSKPQAMNCIVLLSNLVYPVSLHLLEVGMSPESRNSRLDWAVQPELFLNKPTNEKKGNFNN